MSCPYETVIFTTRNKRNMLRPYGNLFLKWLVKSR